MLTAAEVAERPRLTLTAAEIVEITGGLTQPAAQLRELLRQGYVRAHRPRGGAVVLPRAHFEAVKAQRARESHEAGDRIATSEPMLPRPSAYEGSALQRWHQEQREITEASTAAAAVAKAEAMALWMADAPAREARRRQQRAAIVRHHAGLRRAEKLQRTPSWADDEAIRAIYAEAQRLSATTGVPHVVDHEYPLRGKLVSGLHVHQNLRVITAVENSRKRNKFEPC